MKQYSLFDPAPVVVTPPVEDLGGKLRPYQTDVLDRGRKHIGRGRKRGIIQIDTGGGKSYVAGEIARCALLKGSRVLILADRRKLVTQLGKALQAFKVPYGVIMSDSTSAPWLPCITASRDTLHAWKKRELTMPDPFQIIIIDECHKAPGYVYQELLALWPDAVVIGMTATPARGDGRRLDGTFQWLECAVPITQLIREGWLVPSEIYWPKELAKQRKVGKGKREVAGDPVSHWVRHAEGMATIGFCNSINQSVKYRDLFIKAGIAAEHIDADTPDKERDRIYERLAERETLVLFSVGLLIEGIDIAEVSAAIMLKKFGSIVEWRQACGRTKRPCPSINKTKSIILDHTGASGIHGSPDEEIEWSLDPNSTVSQRRKEKLKNENINPIVCRTCGGMYSGKSQCPFCGADAPKMKKSSLQQEADERDEILSRRDMDDESKEWAMKENYHTTYKKIVAIAANRNLTYKAVVALFRKQTGMWPSDAGIIEPPRERWGEKANILFPNYTAKKAKRP